VTAKTILFFIGRQMQYRKRECLLVDSKVQGSLILRVIGYWFACIVTIELLNLSWLIATGPDQPTFADALLNHDWRPSYIRVAAGAVLLSAIVYDMLRFSNRFAGPVFRMQRALRNVEQNGTVESVRLRENDYWQDFAADLNLALAKLASERAANPADRAEGDAEERPVGKLASA
jgi:hypothetical protein